MDSFRLKEEQLQLQKDVTQLKHIKEVMEIRIKQLHLEEMRYLQEIPTFKSRVEEGNKKISVIQYNIKSISEQYSKVNDDLSLVNKLVAEQSKLLEDIQKNGQDISVECDNKKRDIFLRNNDLKVREASIQERENNCINRESFCRKIESDLDKRELEIKNKEKELEKAHKELDSSLTIHSNNIAMHTENIRSLNQRKIFQSQDEELLKIKLNKADKMIKENSELKANLLLQAEKYSKATIVAEEKQKSLDRSIADLQNQENALKIKDLKIRKMAHDSDLQKELKELEAQYK